MTHVNPAQSRGKSASGNRNSRQRADEVSAMLTVASDNVRTLAPKQETRGYAKISGCMLLSRVHALESQFNDSGALIIGVQDGRAKEEQLRAGVFYQMVVSAASVNGSYGVQAWFHKSLGPEVLAVNVVNPRLLAVAAKLSKVSVCVTLVVGHAPTSVSDLEDRSNFFHQTGELILRMRHAFPRSAVFLVIDANARVCSETCGNIGGAGAEKETESGQLFRIMLNRTSMCAVKDILGCWMDVEKYKDDDWQN